MDILEELKAPFAPEVISWRIQGSPYKKGDDWFGLALAYIDARDVMNRLDAAVGSANWSDHYQDSGKRTYCTLSIRIDGEWVSKTDAAGDSDIEGEKGAVSDSLKRAAVKWGIGRYLYDVTAPWVKCKVSEKNGKTYWKEWIDDPWKQVTMKDYSPLWEQGFANSATRNEYFRLLQLAIQGAEDVDQLSKFKSAINRVGKTDQLTKDNIEETYNDKHEEFKQIFKMKEQLNEV
jgi:hypothetical protein